MDEEFDYDRYEEECEKTKQRNAELIALLDPDPEELPTREELIRGLTIMLFALTSWEERIGGKDGLTYRRAWESADWDALDALGEGGYVSFTNKAKSVTVTEKGMDYANALIRSFGFGYLLEE